MEFISGKLIKLIERDADQLTNNWLSNVQNHPTTPTYHTYDKKKIYQRAFRVYSQLGKWISRETSKEDIEKYYTASGGQRRKEEFALSKVIQALIITRRHVWLKVLSCLRTSIACGEAFVREVQCTAAPSLVSFASQAQKRVFEES